MRKKEFFIRNGKYLSFALAGLALVFFIVACVTHGGVSVLFHVLWILFLLGAFALFTYAYKAGGLKVCYFLYDHRRKIKIKETALNFELLDDNLVHYIRSFGVEPLELWNGIPKSLQIQTDATPAYRPLYCYRMLYALCDLPDQTIKELFYGADIKVLQYVCRYIAAAGDQEMADVIRKLRSDAEFEEKRVVPFFKKNKPIFEGRMLRFVLEHKNAFMIDISDTKEKNK